MNFYGFNMVSYGFSMIIHRISMGFPMLSTEFLRQVLTKVQERFEVWGIIIFHDLHIIFMSYYHKLGLLSRE